MQKRKRKRKRKSCYYKLAESELTHLILLNRCLFSGITVISEEKSSISPTTTTKKKEVIIDLKMT